MAAHVQEARALWSGLRHLQQQAHAAASSCPHRFASLQALFASALSGSGVRGAPVWRIAPAMLTSLQQFSCHPLCAENQADPPSIRSAPSQGANGTSTGFRRHSSITLAARSAVVDDVLQGHPWQSQRTPLGWSPPGLDRARFGQRLSTSAERPSERGGRDDKDSSALPANGKDAEFGASLGKGSGAAGGAPIAEVDAAEQVSAHEVAEAAMNERTILRTLWNYLTAEEHPEFRRRIALAMVLLFASKAINVTVWSEELPMRGDCA